MASPPIFPVLLLILGATFASARLAHPNFPKGPIIPYFTIPNRTVVSSLTGQTLPPLDTVYYFDQLIDHDNPGLGTFKQRYWHTWEWYEAGM